MSESGAVGDDPCFGLDASVTNGASPCRGDCCDTLILQMRYECDRHDYLDHHVDVHQGLLRAHHDERSDSDVAPSGVRVSHRFLVWMIVLGHLVEIHDPRIAIVLEPPL